MAAAARDCGERLRLFTGNRSVYRHELSRLTEADLDIVDLDTSDMEQVRRALKEVPDLHGLISSTDTWSLVALELAEEFGLPHQNPESVRVARDKARMRDLLHSVGLSRGPAFRFDPAAVSACELTEHIAFPAIIKDTAGTGSQNVWLLDGPEDVPRVLAQANAVRLRGKLLAEPYFIGPLYSMETLTWENRTRLLGVNSRTLSSEPYFREEALSFPVAFPPARLAELAEWIDRVLAAISYTTGFSHTEFVLTKRGPEVVEINPRIGGGLIAEAMCRALRINMYEAYLDMALGRRPALLDAALEPVGAVSQMLLYPERPGVLDEIGGGERLVEHPGELEIYPIRLAGDRVEHVTDQRGCVGILLATGDTPELALHNVLSAAGKVRVHMKGETT
jgi:biotin carboxylase